MLLKGTTPLTVVGMLFVMIISSSCAQQPPTSSSPAWPTVTTENKPWTRWWWMGSSVDKKGLTKAMEAYKEVGLGGLEITPIYGVQGREEQFIQYLSPEWMNMLAYTLDEASRLELGIDMATGTGWPFGGPWVHAKDASKKVVHKTYTLNEGERLDEAVTYQQKAFGRAVGQSVDVKELVEPIAENNNLQALALEQVRFEKPLPLEALVAYSDKGKVLNLTDRVDSRGTLDWRAPEGQWTLYAVFQGWHGKMVERAAPGGEGYVIDHFSKPALQNYLERFDRAFGKHTVDGVRAFFNDSYEVDDASGEAGWTPDFFKTFEKRQGYDLREHLPALFGDASKEENIRVLSDYRATISDLLLERFTQPWQKWAQSKNTVVRNQAHGSPANIIDLYAASDIPETEGTDILRFKFASSAAHVTGKPLVSSEAATWLNEHFTSSLGDVKKALDRFFLGGVNHTFYHGTNYSPEEEDWPGWLFYAAVHFSPSNPFWNHFSDLNAYVARVQSFLQRGKPDNDILLYFPVHDLYAEPGRGLLRHFDGESEQFEGTTFKTDAEQLVEHGYAFDFISDRQLKNVEAKDRLLQTGGVSYQTVVLPANRFVPLKTFKKLTQLAHQGATIIAHEKLPKDVPGLGNLKARSQQLQELKDQIEWTGTNSGDVQEARLGEGRFITGSNLEQLLRYANVRREAMVENNLRFVRRSYAKGNYYFITNWGEQTFNGWVPLAATAASAAIFDPMQKKKGVADVRTESAEDTEAYLQLAPGESVVLKTYSQSAVSGKPYAHYDTSGEPQKVNGTWRVRFTEGGPKLPEEVNTSELRSWTTFGGEAVKHFSGTATYTVSFERPEGSADGWMLDLGQVYESASVRLNGKELGTLFGPSYQLSLQDDLLEEQNTLEIEVANLMANRAAYLDQQGKSWKKFYNINFSARKAENRDQQGLFTASHWKPKASGLLGPVSLVPLAKR